MPDDIKTGTRPDIDQMKRDFVAACRILVAEGVSEAAFNISARVDADTWMTMPVTSPTLVTVDNIEIHRISEPAQNWKAHPAVYRERPDAGGIVHVHPPHVVAFSTLGEEFVPVHHYGAPFHGLLTTYESPGQTKSDDRAAELARQLGQNRAILQRGHGIVMVGKDLREAVLLVLFLEEAVRMNMVAKQMGKPKFLTPEQSAKITPQILKQRSQDKAWDHYVNKTKLRGFM
jgi:ribulose-5-phosphate 4-epimerase/fuculose-1-phosphate aldolase